MRKLLQMLSAVSMLVCAGQFDAFGSTPAFIEEDDAKRQQLGISFRNQQQQPTDIFPKEVLQLVLAPGSSGTHPVDLQLVCTSWRNVMRENKPLQNEIKFVDLNPFMKTCMNVWWAEQFRNAVLRYTDPIDATVIDLKFCDFPNGTFDISKCGRTGNFIRMTQSVDEFLQVEGDNKDKVIILFAEREMIERLINFSAKPFVKILEGWDPSYPFGIFWRRGNDKPFDVDCLTNAHAKQISSRNIFENWKNSKMEWGDPRGWFGAGHRFSLVFMSIF